MGMLEVIADYLIKLQAAITAHPQATERTSYKEKEKKVHETLSAANRIIVDILDLTGLPQSPSTEELIDPLDDLISTIESLGTDVDDVNIRSSGESTSRTPGRKTGQKMDGNIKAIVEDIVALAALIRINADIERRRLQDLQRLIEEKRKDLQRLTEEKQQALSELAKTKDQGITRLEMQLSILQSLRCYHTLLF